MGQLSIIDWAVCAAHLGVVFGLALWSMRGQRDNDDYFVVGRFTMFHLDSNLLAAENFTSRNSVYTAVAFSLFMYLPGYTVAQNMIQRYVCSVPEFTGVADRMGRRPPPGILGTLDDDPAAEMEIVRWCDIAKVLHDLQRARIGHFGHTLKEVAGVLKIEAVVVTP